MKPLFNHLWFSQKMDSLLRWHLSDLYVYTTTTFQSLVRWHFHQGHLLTWAVMPSEWSLVTFQQRTSLARNSTGRLVVKYLMILFNCQCRFCRCCYCHHFVVIIIAIHIHHNLKCYFHLCNYWHLKFWIMIYESHHVWSSLWMSNSQIPSGRRACICGGTKPTMRYLLH